MTSKPPISTVSYTRRRDLPSDCGKGFAQIGRTLGRYICGKPFNLYYDDD
jgi:hypothetical protein